MQNSGVKSSKQLFGEFHLCDQILKAGIGADGIESGILAEPVHATAAPIGFAQPLKGLILIP
jgi:hypothetical protein